MARCAVGERMEDDDTGDDEYEITPAMMQAGIAALGEFDMEYESPKDCVERIYWAMIDAKFSEPPLKVQNR